MMTFSSFFFQKIEVTFEFCDLKAIDYHAIKHLISQLLRIARQKKDRDSEPADKATQTPLAVPPSKPP